MAYRQITYGFSKSGKTGSLACLAEDGWTIRYLDFDDNPTPLYAFCKPEFHKNIQRVSCLDEFRVNEIDNIRSTGGSGLKAYSTMMSALDEWPIDKSDPQKWDADKNILCIDSLTSVAKAKVRAIQVRAGREDKKYNWDDYQMTQREIDALLQALKTWVNCPIIVMAHLQLIGPDLDAADIDDEDLRAQIIEQKLKGADIMPWRLAPITIGKAQALTVAGHFTAAALVHVTEASGRRIISKPMQGLDLGIPIPGVAGELPLETGMATIFKAVRKASTAPAPTKARK